MMEGSTARIVLLGNAAPYEEEEEEDEALVAGSVPRPTPRSGWPKEMMSPSLVMFCPEKKLLLEDETQGLFQALRF